MWVACVCTSITKLHNVRFYDPTSFWGTVIISIYATKLLLSDKCLKFDIHLKECLTTKVSQHIILGAKQLRPDTYAYVVLIEYHWLEPCKSDTPAIYILFNLTVLLNTVILTDYTYHIRTFIFWEPCTLTSYVRTNYQISVRWKHFITHIYVHTFDVLSMQNDTNWQGCDINNDIFHTCVHVIDSM